MVALELSDVVRFLVDKKVDEVTFAPYYHLVNVPWEVTRVASAIGGSQHTLQ